MLYMQSFAASDGSYSLDRDLRHRHRSQLCAGARAEPRFSRHGVAAAIRAGAGRRRSEEIDRDPADRDADVAGQTAIDSLYLSNYATIRLKDEIARLPRCRQRQRLRRRSVFDADLARSGQDAGAQPRCAGRDPGAAAAERAGDRPARSGMPPAPGDQAFQYTVDVVGRFDDPAQFANVVVKTGANGELYAAARCRPRRTRRADYTGRFSTSTESPRPASRFSRRPGANALDVATEVVEPR